MRIITALAAFTLTCTATADLLVNSWEKWYDTSNAIRYFGQEYKAGKTNIDNGRIAVLERDGGVRVKLFNATKPNAVVGGTVNVVLEERMTLDRLVDQLPDGATVVLDGPGLLDPLNLRDAEVGAWIKRGTYTLEYQGFEPGDKFVMDLSPTS